MDSNKSVGYGIIVLGIVLLLITFALAINAFLNPDFIEGFAELVETNREGIAGLVDMLIYLIPAILLFVMGSIGGKIISYGVKLVGSPDPDSEKRSGKQTGRKVRRQPSPKETRNKRTKIENTKTPKTKEQSPKTPPPPPKSTDMEKEPQEKEEKPSELKEKRSGPEDQVNNG